MPQKTSRTTAPQTATDSPDARKARGAFFTPAAIAKFISEWAIRSDDDRVLEPSCGDAEFLVHAVERLNHLGADAPAVAGVEIHEDSAATAVARVLAAGGRPDIVVSDFFLVEPAPAYSAVIGNPPYIRFQDWSGEARDRSRAAAAEAGVKLSGLASSWVAFTVHATSFLAPGGRVALVLPAELLSVNYAAPVRRFLLENFNTVELVTFEEQVFPEAEVDVVVLLVDGYGQGPASHLSLRQARDAGSLTGELPASTWMPADPSSKWTPALMHPDALALYLAATADADFTTLDTWGKTTLGIVTGDNAYFALTPERVAELGLEPGDLLPLSPPRSRHLRGLELSREKLTSLGDAGKQTWLFRPAHEPSEAGRAYIEEGEKTGMATNSYKCRVRKTWWRVPQLEAPHLFLTCMNADTARITTNEAEAHHLNSVHGIYLRDELRELGRELLPLASLNTVTLLGAETVGRAYGGGVLKLEPGDANALPVPRPALVARMAGGLRAIRGQVLAHLEAGRLLDAVALVDDVLLADMAGSGLMAMRGAHAALTERRVTRSRGGGPAR